jgi:hypothetical protein
MPRRFESRAAYSCPRRVDTERSNVAVGPTTDRLKDFTLSSMGPSLIY